MRNSWKLGACAAICASVAFIGCGDDNGSDGNNGGSGGKGGNGGASAGSGGGTAGQSNGGSSAGKGGGGGTPNGGSGAGKGGGGAGGSAPEGGSAAEGGANGDGMGGESLGGQGMGGEGNAPACTPEELGAGGSSDGEGGAGGGASHEVTTAVVLIDDVVVTKAAATLVEWQFADGTAISDATDYPADKWSRIVFDPGSLGDDPGARCTFLHCDGDPAAGSLKAVVPFTAADQYYELGVPFAAADYSETTVTARVKLVSGGKPDAACPVRGQLYSTGTTPNDGPGVALIEGQWVTLTMELGAGFAGTDRIGVRLNTYGC